MGKTSVSREDFLKNIKPSDLSGDLREIAEECGTDLALTLADKFGSMQLYIKPIEKALIEKQKQYIKLNFTGNNHRELARAVRCSQRWIYDVIREADQKKKEDKQVDLLDLIPSKKHQ